MAWLNWSRKSAPPPSDERISLLGLDLNATRARAAVLRSGRPRLLTLDDPKHELALAVSMEHRSAQVGQPGVGVLRRLPHVSCAGYLADLGLPREWRAGRHRIDAAAALAL